MLNYAEVEAFLAVAHYSSITKAAENLFITQSALSYRIQLLESELGMQLTYRKKGARNVTLTERGNEFITLANELIAIYGKIEGFRHTEFIQTISISVLDSINKYIMPQVMEKFWSHNLPISLSISTNRSTGSYTLIENKKIDMAIVSTPIYSNQIILIPLYNEKMKLVCSSVHDYPDIVCPSKLDPKKEIYLSWSPSYQQWHDKQFGSTITTRYQLDNTLLMTNCLLEHDTWAIVPAIIAINLANNNNIQVCDLQDGPNNRVYSLAFNKNTQLNQHLEVFINDFISVISKNNDINVFQLDLHQIKKGLS